MAEDDYISTLVTPDMLEDPDEPGIHPMEAMSRRLDASLMEGGTPLYRQELRPGVKPTYRVTFIPKKGSARLPQGSGEVKGEVCPGWPGCVIIPGMATDSLHHFDFDLDRGIRAQVVEKLEGSPLLPLEKGAGPYPCAF
jgi:hypothetical protein